MQIIKNTLSAKHRISPKRLLVAVVAVFVLCVAFAGVSATRVLAAEPPKMPEPTGGYYCGSGKNAVKVSVNIGCQGQSCQTANPDGCNAMLDLVFAIIRLLSMGVGVVIVASTVWAGIQYTMSRGDPSGTTKAIGRLQNNVIALLIFIFGYAILNYLIPAGFFR
jgi:hypothetical protein